MQFKKNIEYQFLPTKIEIYIIKIISLDSYLKEVSNDNLFWYIINNFNKNRWSKFILILVRSL
jgi:hypothetical protein